MATRARFAFVFVVSFALAASLFAQGRDPVSPGVGRAVLLATNSIQVEREGVVVSGDLVVNDSAAGPFLGQAQLDLDRNVLTSAGWNLIADSIDIDRDTVLGGDVYSNELDNDGTILGSTFSPLGLPVFGVLPALLNRAAGHEIVSVPDHTTVDVEEGEYTLLLVGKGGVARLTGNGYTFTAINIDKDASVQCVLACNVVVRTKLTGDQNVSIGPAAGASTGAEGILFHVNGGNGSGNLTTNPAVKIGRDSEIQANIYAPGGTISIDRDSDVIGALFGRDILIGRNGTLTLASAFNLPPIADPQTVFTDGAQPVTITLTGSDPEGGALTFAIVSGPTNGVLSPLSGATVTYTPNGAGNLEDAFTFSVTDPDGTSDTAVVTINPPTEEPPPPPPGTVVASDLFADVTGDMAETLVLQAAAPVGVTLTFSIVSSAGPFHGQLSAITHDTQATVVYTPDAGYAGPDQFQFEACGVVSSTTVCDTATFFLNVIERRVEEPDLAHDVEVTTKTNTQVLISLGVTSVESLRTFKIRPTAAFLDSAEVGGTVADANNDGIGDNHMVLPASVPVFMSAAVGQSGGPGSNGTVRMQFEWDLSGFPASPSSLRSAKVVLNTHRGAVDSLDTQFYHVQSENDGLLDDSDFAASAERVRGAVMKVPPSMPLGTDGTHEFSVFAEVLSALEANRSFFTIQGRVNEATVGTARGLEVRTSVTLNRNDGLEPMMQVTTPGVSAPLQYRIITLPANGTLFDNSVAITSVPHTLAGSLVAFTPTTGFIGNTQFTFEVDNGFTIDQAFANIHVIQSNCDDDVDDCDDGRP